MDLMSKYYQLMQYQATAEEWEKLAAEFHAQESYCMAAACRKRAKHAREQ